MKLRNILLLGTLVCAPAAIAQYNPTVNVEGKYKPEVILQDRINAFPERVRLGALESSLEYDLDGVVYDFTPSGVPMPAVGWNDTREKYPYRGYVDLSLGSWLDTRLNAGYRFVSKPNTLGGVYLRHNSTWLWKPEFQHGENDFRRRLADQELGVYLRHLQPGAGMLDFNLKYRAAWFNYYAFNPEFLPKGQEAPEQTLNNVDFHLMWRSDDNRKFRYYAGADLRFNGFRSYYADLAQERFRGNRELIISPRGGLEFGFGRRSSLGIKIGADAVLYVDKNGNTQALECPENYTRLSLTPYYKKDIDNVYLFAGPRIDMMFNNGPFFRIAPDFRLGWHMKGIALELTATGGTELNTLDYNVGQNLYCSTNIYNAEPVYVPFEGGLKFAFGPFAGFRAEISGTFRRALGQHVEGAWYQPYMNGDLYWNGGIGQAVDYNNATVNMYGVSMGLKLSYNYGRYFGIVAEATYQPQEGKKGYFNGYDLAEATGHVSVTSNPWSTLKFGFDWNMRACRKPLLVYPDAEGVVAENVRMKNWSSLDFHAEYSILKNLRAEIGVRNLLNRLHQEWLPGLQSPGITAHLGLTFQF